MNHKGRIVVSLLVVAAALGLLVGNACAWTCCGPPVPSRVYCGPPVVVCGPPLPAPCLPVPPPLCLPVPPPLYLPPLPVPVVEFGPCR